jgi:hypothetical protein
MSYRKEKYRNDYPSSHDEGYPASHHKKNKKKIYKPSTPNYNNYGNYGSNGNAIRIYGFLFFLIN